MRYIRGPCEHMFVTRERVKELRAQGLGLVEIARMLGVTRSTVAYHLRRMGVPPDPRFSRRYDWSEVQAYYDEGNSTRLDHRRPRSTGSSSPGAGGTSAT